MTLADVRQELVAKLLTLQPPLARLANSDLTAEVDKLAPGVSAARVTVLGFGRATDQRSNTPRQRARVRIIAASRLTDAEAERAITEGAWDAWSSALTDPRWWEEMASVAGIDADAEADLEVTREDGSDVVELAVQVAIIVQP